MTVVLAAGAWHPQAEQQRGLRVTAWLKAGFFNVSVVSRRSIRGDRYGRDGVWQWSPFHRTCSSAPFLRPGRMCREREEVFDHLLPTEAFVFDFANASL